MTQPTITEPDTEAFAGETEAPAGETGPDTEAPAGEDGPPGAESSSGDDETVGGSP